MTADPVKLSQAALKAAADAQVNVRKLKGEVLALVAASGLPTPNSLALGVQPGDPNTLAGQTILHGHALFEMQVLIARQNASIDVLAAALERIVAVLEVEDGGSLEHLIRPRMRHAADMAEADMRARAVEAQVEKSPAAVDIGRAGQGG